MYIELSIEITIEIYIEIYIEISIEISIELSIELLLNIYRNSIELCFIRISICVESHIPVGIYLSNRQRRTYTRSSVHCAPAELEQGLEQGSTPYIIC